MPSGQSLLSFMKKNPNIDAKNLITPSNDSRFLGFKERAGQTKNIFEILTSGDVVHFSIEPTGRWIKIEQQSGYTSIHFIKGTIAAADLTAAIAAIGATGGEIILPAGIVSLTADVVIDKSIVIKGAGGVATKLTLSTNKQVIISTNQVALRDLYISRADASITAVNCTSWTDFTIENCIVEAPLTGGIGIGVYSANRVSIVGCKVTAELALDIQATSNFMILRNRIDCQAPGPSYGTAMQLYSTGDNILIADNYGNGNLYIATAGGSVPFSMNGIIHDNIFHGTIFDAVAVGANVFMHGNSLGSVTGSPPALMKMRDNIGVADQN